MWRYTTRQMHVPLKNFRSLQLWRSSPKSVKMEVKDVIKVTEPNVKVDMPNPVSLNQENLHVRKDIHDIDEIPGPPSLKTISKIWSLFPLAGIETTTTLIRYFLRRDSLREPHKLFFKRLFDQYGPIVKLHGIFGSDIVLLCRPEHAKIALNCEKQDYVRCYFDSMDKYRKEFRRYTKSGPFLKYHENWEITRKSLEESKLPINTVHTLDDTLSDQFITRITEVRNDQGELSDEIKTELYKWSLECVSLALLHKEFGFLKQHFLLPTSDSGRLLDGVIGATEAVKKLESGFQFWKFTETPAFHSLVKNCNIIDLVLCKYVEKATKNLREKHENVLSFSNLSLLESMLLKKGLVEDDIMTILLDTFVITTNVTCHTVAQLLFCLAKNPRSQIKLHEEIVRKGEVVTFENIDKRNYLNACIKECLRINPPIPILSRQLEDDILLNHYRIPKNTRILFSTHLNRNREEYFEDATRFKPERWLPGDLGEYGQEYQNFAKNYFGFGPDARSMRKIMHLQIARLLVTIILKFKIEYNHGETRSNVEFLTPSNKNIKLRFVNRIQ